jgi:hypothetical protein
MPQSLSLSHWILCKEVSDHLAGVSGMGFQLEANASVRACGEVTDGGFSPFNT